MKNVVLVLLFGLLALTQKVHADHKNYSEPFKKFVKEALNGNSGAEVSGGGIIILDEAKLKAKLKGIIREDTSCAAGGEGWLKGTQKNFEMNDRSKAKVVSYYHLVCEEADQNFADSFVLFYPGSGKQVLLIPNALQTIDFVKAYAGDYSGRGTASVMIVGSRHSMGGGVDSSIAIRIDSPDSLQDSEIKQVQ